MKNSDIQQYFIEKGQGEALILLHGNGENCGYFQGQMEAFSKRYHVYAIDTRGHGRTPRGSRPYGSSRKICGISWTGSGLKRRTCWGFPTAGISLWSLPYGIRTG